MDEVWSGDPATGARIKYSYVSNQGGWEARGLCGFCSMLSSGSSGVLCSANEGRRAHHLHSICDWTSKCPL
jgi:hypothetical protein